MTLKQKNIILFIGFVLLLWLGYVFSFSKTFQLKKQYKSIKKEQELLTNVSQQLVSLKQQNVFYDSILKSKKITSENSYQNNLLQIITSFSDSSDVKVVNFINPHIYKTDDVALNTFSFTVNGCFSMITKLVYELEQHYKLGKVISVNFVKKKNYRRNTHFLECSILLQRVQQ